MSNGRNGSAVPYTAYKSKRAQAQSLSQSGNSSVGGRPSSRPTSFIGGDVWGKANNILGDLVKGAEGMSQEVLTGLTSPHANGNGIDPSHILGSLTHTGIDPSLPQSLLHNGTNSNHAQDDTSPSPGPRSTEQSAPSPPSEPLSTVKSTIPTLSLENGPSTPLTNESDAESEGIRNGETSSGHSAHDSEPLSPPNLLPVSHDPTSAKAESSTSRTTSPTSSPGASSSKLPPSPTRIHAKKTSFRYIPRSSPLNPRVAASSRTPSISSVLPTPSSPGASTPAKFPHEPPLPSVLEPTPTNTLASVSNPFSTLRSQSHGPIPIHDTPNRTGSRKSLPPAPQKEQPLVRDMTPSPARSLHPPMNHASSISDAIAVPPRVSSPRVSTGGTNTPATERKSDIPPNRTPYRAGFQPKGVYRPRTDEFNSLRRQFRDGGSTKSLSSPAEWDTPLGRVERTKLERRLEKLIQLHFPLQSETLSAPPERRRPSSFIDSLSALSSSLSASDSSRPRKSTLTKAEIRVAEQRITPWEEDSHVKSCWVCHVTFHPLTNRKHHCRLCGHIVCALPISVKLFTPPSSETHPHPTPRPLRPVKCSYLFVVDESQGCRRIEEVGEGVDYGVKRHRVTSSGSHHAPPDLDDDRFLRGVRICRACRPIMFRAQYAMELAESNHGPQADLLRFYEAMVALEKEIEERLPAFHELINSSPGLGHDVTSSQIALMRKHLLESFSSYDAVAKRIAALPHSRSQNSSKGKNNSPSGEERVQAAILMRARIFLEKNMFPLKKTLSSVATASKPESPNKGGTGTVKEKALHDKLQPLLEQEALLETFVEQAQASRKFEDVKTLRQNLLEIREEIDKIVKTENSENAGKKAKSRKR